MSSPEAQHELYNSSLVSNLINNGLSSAHADRVNVIVERTAEAMNKRGDTDVDVVKLATVIDNALALKKGSLRCSVIINARDALKSLIDPEQKPA